MSLERYDALIQQSEPHLEVRSVLGSGGWGKVFEAWHTGLDRAVAIKIIHADIISQDPQAWQRFHREAMTLSRLTHKNIVRVYSFGRLNDSSPFITMELIKGVPLADKVRQTSLSLEQFQDIFGQTCDALNCLHDNDVLHRDLKSSNLMLLKDDLGNDLIKLVDFGLALDHGVAGGELQRLTATGEVVGTAEYMSPEQCVGSPLDHRSDIYSLGCILYESLAGHPPFMATSCYECMLMHVSDEPPELNYTAANEAAAKRAKNVIQRCLEKEPADRYQSAHEVKDDLLRIFKTQTPLSLRRSKAKPRSHGSSNLTRPKTPLLLLIPLVALAGLAIGQVAMQKQNAQDLMRKQVVLDESDGIHFPYVEELMARGEHEKALEAARMQVEARSTHNSRALLARCLSNCDKPDEAVSIMDSIIRAHPENHFFAVRALICYKAGRYKDCIRDFDVAIPLKHRVMPDWLAMRGFSQYNIGNSKAALADFQAALDTVKPGTFSTFKYEQDVRAALDALEHNRPIKTPSTSANR